MRWGFDAEYAPDDVALAYLATVGYSFGGGYIGGKAAHIWTPHEWDRLLHRGFDIYPIFVAPLQRDAGRQAGVDDGNLALEAMYELGFSGVFVLDVENGLVPQEYAGGLVDAATAGQCGVDLYGSRTTLEQLVRINFRRWWLAMPGGAQQTLPTPVDWSMWQWGSSPGLDLDVCVDDFVFAAVTR